MFKKFIILFLCFLSVPITTTVSATVKEGWIKTNNSYFYYKDGKAYTGWHWMTKKEGEKTPHWSYFGNDGKLRTN